MMASDRRPGVQAPLEGLANERPGHGTLPPPEWRSSPALGDARPTTAAPSLHRRSGARADEAWLRARVDEARAAEDAEATRTACVALARWLASRDRDLDEAVELAACALAIAEDVELRWELSAWLESLGESARAAGALKPIATSPGVESAEAAYVLVRTGVLRARAGATASAAAAFDAALSIEPGNALPPELLGALSAWGPEVVSPSDAAEAYVEAARRPATSGQEDAELED